ncbi:MAG: iron-sulfur cluster assembly protein [Chitinophagaceae bacterium]|nr:iron-sulfur cluster assembly protein [Chitinophagaceae bacterium]
MTNEQILAALSHVQEPDLGQDIVTLNMVKDIQIEGNKVSFTVVLTTPACPLKDLIKNNCVKAVKTHVNANAEVLVNFSANTSSRREDNGAVLPKVKKYYCCSKWQRRCGKINCISQPGPRARTTGRQSRFDGC